MTTPPGSLSRFVALALTAVAVLLLAPWVGPSAPAWDAVTRPGAGDIDAVILWSIRVPRVLLAFIAGMGLSLGGVVFQALFRNPLASPYTLGVAGGASVGVALALYFGYAGASSMASMTGAACAIAMVHGAARAAKRPSSQTMLLAGVAASFFFSSIIMLLQYLGDMENSLRIVRWLLGDISRADGSKVVQLSPFILTGVLVVLFFHRDLDLLSIDDDVAASRGVPVNRVRLILFLTVSLMIGGIVTVCGPVGFVGIMVPHVCRIMGGATHRRLIVHSLLAGGVFLTLCDTLGRLISFRAEIPVGIITAILGGPFFLWILLRSDEPAL